MHFTFAADSFICEKHDFKGDKYLLEISKIYINFSSSESFLKSIALDERSFSSNLITRAMEVLLEVGQSEVFADLQGVEAKLRKAAVTKELDDEIFIDAPDHFLDAILSHLMADPVLLPNSKQVVDRSTIMRHLLSDPSDPFTRAPLSMNQIQPLPDLKKEIEDWKRSRREARNP